MPRQYRQDSVQINLRLRQAERDRIWRSLPRGSLNAVAVQLIMDYVQALEVSGSRPQLAPREDSAA